MHLKHFCLRDNQNPPMSIDLHTHSTASDGGLGPRELFDAAVASGVQVLALTDHDTIAGYKQLVTEGYSGCELIAGVELSCQWSNTTVHVVGLKIELESPVLMQGLYTLNQARIDRASKIAERLAKLGFEGTLEGAMSVAGESQIGRPHFAKFMTERGYVKDEVQAFDKYLGAGKCGDVKAFWPSLPEAVGWITESGGVAVLAHPLKYRFTRTKLRRLLTDFCYAGGRAVEVISGRQQQEDTRYLARTSADFELLASIGSDFHRQRPYGAGLGSSGLLPSVCTPVWTDWDLDIGNV